jgi:hypothetical protein
MVYCDILGADKTHLRIVWILLNSVLEDPEGIIPGVGWWMVAQLLAQGTPVSLHGQNIPDKKT